MKKSLLMQLVKRCREDFKKHCQKNHFPHWCFIVNNNKIISYGTNNAATPHPKWGYHSNQILKGETFKPKTHAELNAISRSHQRIHGCIAINIRLNAGQNLRMSAPCLICQRLLVNFGIKKCIFSHEAGWGEMKF